MMINTRKRNIVVISSDEKDESFRSPPNVPKAFTSTSTSKAMKLLDHALLTQNRFLSLIVSTASWGCPLFSQVKRAASPDRRK
ncbi:hypothetical protein K503DRAFT_451380 [Rhizopogon vinicolor AM-OR11-026]|uniref:Uncharacterized protein n=1 Tax=Rhizopogon vinicolor AM-OR11-026 TaxID=1314800 RepID=A0A1B7NA79_9AGAM|nr:hypothetical protein K503DRAFT_451380 [Rhizopogon vinicolor AM-OR11-026]